MNRSFPGMSHCQNNSGNVDTGGLQMSVLERQQARMKWQEDQFNQQSISYMNETNQLGVFPVPVQSQEFHGLVNNDQGLQELVTGAMKPDPGLENGWHNFGRTENCFDYVSTCGFRNASALEMNCVIPRTASCPPAVSAALTEATTLAIKAKEAIVPQKLSSAVGRESFKKRKADKNQNLKLITEEQTKDKKMKGCAEEVDSKVTEQSSNSKSTTTSNKETSAGNLKENSKTSDAPKPDYIHVRARRGQATDSHSLAERVRREKISERMKYLQDLVPGCNKITGKAGMLDEIINYVQSLQRQVEFLSMKLAAINPRLDFDMDNLLAKEMLSACTSGFPTTGVTSDMVNPAQLQFNALSQGLEMSVNPMDATLRRTISAPVTLPEAIIDSSNWNQIQQSTWDSELLYSMEFQQGRSTSFINQPFAGLFEAGHVKLEM